MEEILTQTSKAIIVNELQLLNNSSIPTTIKSTKFNAGYELKCFPQSQKMQLPVKIWLLSESDILTFEILKNSGKKNVILQITLSDLKNELSASFFSVGNKLLVKYLVELKSDCCDNLLLRIQTIDKKEFYCRIND